MPSAFGVVSLFLIASVRLNKVLSTHRLLKTVFPIASEFKTSASSPVIGGGDGFLAAILHFCAKHTFQSAGQRSYTIQGPRDHVLFLCTVSTKRYFYVISKVRNSELAHGNSFENFFPLISVSPVPHLTFYVLKVNVCREKNYILMAFPTPYPLALLQE